MYCNHTVPDDSRRLSCRRLIAIVALSCLTSRGWSQVAPQSPLSPEATLDHFELHPDCRIELVAAEPDVIDPVAIAFGPDGRLWVVEYSDYPNGPPENGPPLSRIRTLTDADGDGRYTDAVTFADKLLFATGLMLWQDGVIVTMDGSVTFMRDLDGDGKADEQTEWFRGFKQDNPQLRANHPTLGLDGHIYIASGLRGGEVIATRTDWPFSRSASNSSPLPSGKRVPEGRVRGKNDESPSSQPTPPRGEGAIEPQPVSLSGRDFRFDPFTGEYEAVSGPGQFGLCFDCFGNRFVCSNRNPCNHIVLEDRYLARNPYLAVSKVFHEVSPAAENSRLFPISRTWTTSNLHANQFTAACGLLIYGGDALPQFRGNAFVCEPTGNLVHRDVLEPMGATFTSHYGREGVEFLASRDEWFRPVNLTHGPDGALYVVDMYRAVIEHPQFMPEELKTRPDLTLGNDRGRIYRIVSRTPGERAHDSSFRTEPELLAEQVASPNAWHRETAFRLLLEHRHPNSQLQQERRLSSHNRTLDKLLHDVTVKAQSSESKVAVASLLSIVDASFFGSAYFANDRRVHEQLARLAVPADHAGILGGLLENELERQDRDDRLIFQLTLQASSAPRDAKSVRLLTEVAREYGRDPWFRAAVGAASAEIESRVLTGVLIQWRAAVNNNESSAELPRGLVREFARMTGSRGNKDAAMQVLQTLTGPLDSGDADAAVDWQRTQFAGLAALVEGGRRGKLSVSELMNAPEVDGIARQACDWAADTDRSVELRQEALDVVAIDPSPAATDVLTHIVATETDQALVVSAIEALSRKTDARVTHVLLEGFQSRTPSVRAAILSGMLGRTDRINRLLDEIEAGNLSSRDIDATSASRLKKSRDATIRQRAEKLLASTADTDRAQVIISYESCLSQTGDPQRGFDVFMKTCATCHKVGEVGTNVGPDVSDSRTKTPEFLLTNILDPNRAVDGNYFGYTILDTQGRVHTGIITSETASSVTLRMPEGKEITLLRSDIEELANSGQSLMPVGLEKDITLEQMADLISYIKNWRYLDGVVPDEVISR